MRCRYPDCKRRALRRRGWLYTHCEVHALAVLFAAFSDSPLTAPLLDGSRGRQPAAERPPVSASPGLR